MCWHVAAPGMVGFADSEKNRNTFQISRQDVKCVFYKQLCEPGVRVAGPGVVGFANSGKNSNTSQFYLTLAAAPQCDSKHVVIGNVVEGLEILQRIGAS